MTLIALDADGVLLDYHAAYRAAWQRAFGELPALRDPQAYWPIDRWCVQKLTGTSLEHFRAQFDEEFWSTIPAYEGALAACKTLQAEGFDLVCVTAIEKRFLAARAANLARCGFQLDNVFATESESNSISPKAKTLAELKPKAFVDDFLPYFRGISIEIHAALVTREPNGSPNTGVEMAIVNSAHENMDAFAKWWLQTA